MIDSPHNTFDLGVLRRRGLKPPPWRAAAPERREDAAGDEPRMPALDALRGLAMLLGVALHAAIAYMPCRMPRLLWAVQDRSTHWCFDWLFWWIHGFRLPLFFTLSGFFAASLCRRRGCRDFLANRTRRLVAPMCLAGVTLLPALFVIWNAGWLLTGTATTGQVLRFKYDPAFYGEVYTPAHLWFLPHLVVMCFLYAAWRQATSRVRERIDSPRVQRALAALMTSPSAPLLGCVATLLVLAWRFDEPFDFHHDFLPEPSRLAFYGAFFIAGTLLHSARARLHELTAWAPWQLLAAAPAFLCHGWLLREHLESRLDAWQRIALAVSTAAFAWLMIFGLLGTGLRLLNRSRPWTRQPIAASYWIYLIHMPIVGLLHVLTYPLAMPAAVKFSLVTCCTIWCCLFSYRRFVQDSWLGELLNGKRGDASSGAAAGPTNGGRKMRVYGLTGAAALGLCWFCWEGRTFLFADNLHVVLPGALLRSAQPDLDELRAMLESHDVRTVLNLQRGSERSPKNVAERDLCAACGVGFAIVDLPEDVLPDAAQLQDLLDKLEASPRPILAHGRYGVNRAALAAAMALLLEGRSTDEALRQFDPTYGRIDRSPRSSRHVVAAYAEHLQRCERGSSPAELRDWVRDRYSPMMATQVGREALRR